MRLHLYRKRKGIAALRPIQRDQSDFAFGCEADVLVVHATILDASLRHDPRTQL